MKFGLEQNIIDKLIAVFEQHSKVDKALLFGSRAKGNYRPNSDIDIAIKGQDLNTDDIIAMSVAFEEKGITHKIDLINYFTIKEPDLKDHINRIGIELYSRWKEYKLSELADITSSKRIFYAEYVNEGVPFYRSKEIINKYNKQEIQTELFITEKKFKEIKSKFGVPVKDDILLTSVGTLGIPYLVTENDYFYFKDGNLTWFRKIDKSKVDVSYFYIWLQSRIGKQKLDEIAIGSTQPALTIAGLKSIEILLPDLIEQTAIASILSSLDDKIDLLHRQNKTLEQLAETLFREWFVEEVEESWEEITLSEIADHSKENIHPSKNPTKLYKHYSLPAFDAGQEPITEIGKEILSIKYRVISNSILVSKLNPRTPRIWMIYGNVNEDESICSTEFQIVKPKDQKWYGFIYCFLKSYNVTQELAGASSGTSGSHQRVNPQDIFNLTFLKPTDILVEKFSSLMDNYLVKINNNQTQIRTLTQTRDALLPKLMSGEVRVNL
jgi:type I restriction enzyme S subunit